MNEHPDTLKLVCNDCEQMYHFVDDLRRAARCPRCGSNSYSVRGRISRRPRDFTSQATPAPPTPH
jgi:hypothetical protein